jgi:ferrous iron transport protein A
MSAADAKPGSKHGDASHANANRANASRANGGVVPLASLAPGARAVVASVDVATAIGRRLADLGFVPRTPVRVVRRAPLGDPVAYELRGYRLVLRRAEAAQVLVLPTDAGPPVAS